MLFISPKKFFFVLRIFNFLLFSGLIGKQLDKKAKVIFETYNVTNWEQNNYITRIAQFHKK